jgi:hypothetical protein
MEETGPWGAGFNSNVVTDSSFPADQKLDWYCQSGSMGYTTNEVPPAEMFTEGETGGSRSFDAGRSDTASNGAVLFLDGSDSSEHPFYSVETFTIEAFFKTSSSDLQEIVCYGFNDRFALYLEKGQLRFKAGGAIQTLGTVGQYCTGQWCFVAASYETHTGDDSLLLRAFRDGERGSIHSVTDTTSGSLGMTTRNLSIGGDNQGGRGFQGLIDEVRFSDFVRADNELLGNPFPPVGTVLFIS